VTSAVVASLPTIYNFIFADLPSETQEFNPRMIMIYTLTMINTMLLPDFVQLYADVMCREIEWRGSDQFEVMLYLLVLRPFMHGDSLVLIMVFV
jgi:hypothetical protein